MPAATILFIDIVGYSRKSTSEEKKLLEMFNTALAPHVKEFFGLEPKQLACLPTGDGVALAFIHTDGNARWGIESIVGLIFELQSWALAQSTSSNVVSLRIGVHVGVVEVFKDINGFENLCGATLNLAQRIMDAANPRQVLFSEDAVRHYVGEEMTSWKISSGRHTLFRLDGPFDVQVKHGEVLSVYRLLPDGLTDHGWNAEDPEVKFWLSVSQTPSPKKIEGPFTKRFENSRDIALVQLTGERLIEAIKSGKIEFDSHLRRLWVLMPTDSFCVGRDGKVSQNVQESLLKYKQEWIGESKKLATTFPKAKIEILEFHQVPFFGASFLDWEEEGGQIHVSPYIWGMDVTECPGFDIIWSGKRRLPLYEKYVSGLSHLYSLSKKLN